uniref:SH2 domain-containing protein n=1 Tax=Caenorhabditis japonica TaxID=281687 RepID=A0A8R1I2N4_CAEJA
MEAPKDAPLSQKEQETGREAMSQRALSVHKDVTSSNMIPPDVKASKFYHGAVPRVDAEESLRAPGDFLLRKAESKRRCCFGYFGTKRAYRIHAYSVKR